MQLETVERLKRLYDLVDFEPKKRHKKQRLAYNVSFTDAEFPKRCQDPNSSGFYSSNIVLQEPARLPQQDQSSFRKRPKGKDFRISDAIKNYKPPKPPKPLPEPPVKTVRFALEEAPAAVLADPKLQKVLEPAKPTPSSSSFSFSAPSASDKGTNSEPKKPFAFGGAKPTPKADISAEKPESEPKKPLFGAPEAPEVKASATEPKPFSFGAGAKQPDSGFSFGAPKSEATAKSEKPEPKPFSFSTNPVTATKPAGDSKPDTQPFSLNTKPETKPFVFGDAKPSSDSPKPFVFGVNSGAQTSTPDPAKPIETNTSARPFVFGSENRPDTEGFNVKRTLDKPSFNFGANTGTPSFGANNGTPAFGANSGTFGASNGALFGANNPVSGFSSASNPLAGGLTGNPLAGGNTNGRKIAQIRRRIPR